MPTIVDADKNPDFGKNLASLAGVLGHLRPRTDFQRAKLAQVMSITKSQLTKMSAGSTAIPFDGLASLIDYFSLSPNCTYRIFLLSNNEFEQVLKEEQIGTHAGPSDDVARCQLLDRAQREMSAADAGEDTLRIAITSLTQRRRIGGLGHVEPGAHEPQAFRVGGKAHVEVVTPDSGYLVLLNDQLGVEATCLMPSVYAEDPLVPRGRTIVPRSEDKPYFDVKAPTGNFRLFGVWSEKMPKLPWHERVIPHDEPTRLQPREFAAFVRGLNEMKTTLYVATVDYQVKP